MRLMRINHHPSLAALAVTLALAGSLALSCRREEVTHTRVPKESALTAAPEPMHAMGAPAPGGSQPGVPPPPSPPEGSAIEWALPKGWTESRAGGMRYATLKPPVQGRVDVSVVVLPGPAGGELANVNRWRGQIGLAPVDEAALGSSRRSLQTPAGAVAVYDFTSEGQHKTRMIAGILTAGGNSWFLKMVGDAEAVAAARADFMRLLESLRVG
jgi:hypothetical protein